MCVKVTWVGKASDGTISHIGGSDDDGSLPWGLTVAEAVQHIESNEWSFFSARPAADPVAVRVVVRGGSKRLTTSPDDTKTNNLDLLPVNATPMAGVDPQFPLSIPGPRQPSLVQVQGRGSSGGLVVVPPDSAGRFKIPGWTATHPLTRLRITCNAPFPAELEVYIDRDPSQSGYVEATHKLAKVDSMSPAAVRALDQQGLGWYDRTVSIGGTYPHRFTPFVVAVGIPKSFQSKPGVTLHIVNVSYNRYCAGPSTPLSVVLIQTSAYTPPFVYPPSGGSSSSGTTTPPPREYKPGAFVAWSPAVKNIGQSTTKGSKRLQVKSPTDVGTVGWPQYAVYDDSSTSKKLCQPVGFAILPGTGPAAAGAGFSGTGDFGVVLAVLQPNVPAHAGNVLFRFVKLGAAQAQPMDVEAFLTKNTQTVTPRILMDAADQLALVVDANRFGGTPAGRAQLLDLGHNAATLATFEFDGTTISASVTKKSAGTFEAVVTTNQGSRTIPLPKT